LPIWPSCAGGGVDLIQGAVQHHTGGSDHAAAGTGSEEIGIPGGFEAHLVMERVHDEAGHGKLAALGEEGLDAQVGIDSGNVGGVDRAVGFAGDCSVINDLAFAV
jgi:hypothetical protein